MVATLINVAGQGPVAWLRVAVDWAFVLAMMALIVRVVGSWVGASPYTSRWMRLAHRLTDWIVNPIRRVLPPMGMIDFSPLVAYLLLMLIRAFIWSALG
jgi:YggT family protein